MSHQRTILQASPRQPYESIYRFQKSIDNMNKPDAVLTMRQEQRNWVNHHTRTRSPHRLAEEKEWNKLCKNNGKRYNKLTRLSGTTNKQIRKEEQRLHTCRVEKSKAANKNAANKNAAKQKGGTRKRRI